MMMDEGYLFDLSDIPLEEAEKRFKPLETPLWTKNKAKLIAKYLKEFCWVTRHGTYLDAFAGPQHKNEDDVADEEGEQAWKDTWAARLVMSNQPPWLRRFHLFDKGSKQVEDLDELRLEYLASHERENDKRSVSVTKGDSNITLPKFLNENPISDKQATFCLLDQRSTECDWKTVATVANHKGAKEGHKIELFYFLAQGWMDRALKSRTVDVEERHSRWWGNADWRDFLNLPSHERGNVVAQRFKSEFGYKFAYPFPVLKRGSSGGRTMFWMIHASDHEKAPNLMMQAYRHVGAGKDIAAPYEQEVFKSLDNPSHKPK